VTKFTDFWKDKKLTKQTLKNTKKLKQIDKKQKNSFFNFLTLSPESPKSARHLCTIFSGFPLAKVRTTFLNGIRPLSFVDKQR